METFQMHQPSPVTLFPFEFEYATIDENLAIIKHNGTAHYHRETVNGVEIDLIQIPGGSFEMGSNEFDHEKPIHRVTVPGFLMGKYPVTQAQWEAVAHLNQQKRRLSLDPSTFKGADRPVENVTWDDAMEFCARISAHTNRDYCLPSEAEWEYACRAGTTTPFHFGETIDASIANYDARTTYGKGKIGNDRRQTTPVGSFPANAWGLFDCHGNVWEWCSDRGPDSNINDLIDRSSWSKVENTETRMTRGGSCLNNPLSCRSASRGYNIRAYSLVFGGFRVCLSSSFARVSPS
jgi:formylglycine-generating enzyme required for sulfatase activity